MLTRVSCAALGLCEHCQGLVDLTQMPTESTDAKWNCPYHDCGKELTHKSFGYSSGGEDAEKVKWVGPGGKWVDRKPTEDFELNGLEVTTWY